MGTENEAIVEELEALQAIMMDEVTILYKDNGEANGVSCVVVPATGQQLDQQHVTVTLYIQLPKQYPDISPIITLRNPRGIDDDVLHKIEKEIKRKCDEYLGCPVIYELIEVVREALTANNTPSCVCSICLHHFTDNDVFTKTHCYHYFHSHCLGRYIDNCELEAAALESEPTPSWMTRETKQLMCPVCRDNIHIQDRESLHSAPPPQEQENLEEFSANDPNILDLQQKMSALYIIQKEKGGIIDLEKERNKFLLSSDPPEPPQENADLPQDTCPAPTQDRTRRTQRGRYTHREAHMDRNRDSHMERNRDAHMDRNRDSHMERNRDAYMDRNTHTERDRNVHTDSYDQNVQIDRNRDRNAHTERNRDLHTDSYDRNAHMDRHRDRNMHTHAHSRQKYYGKNYGYDSLHTERNRDSHTDYEILDSTCIPRGRYAHTRAHKDRNTRTERNRDPYMDQNSYAHDRNVYTERDRNSYAHDRNVYTERDRNVHTDRNSYAHDRNRDAYMDRNAHTERRTHDYYEGGENYREGGLRGVRGRGRGPRGGRGGGQSVPQGLPRASEKLKKENRRKYLS